MQSPTAAPFALPVTVDTTGAKILDGSPAERDSRDIYLPNHVETVSHIAIDVGGSLAKVVYFTRIARPSMTPEQSGMGEAQPAAAAAAAAAAEMAKTGGNGEGYQQADAPHSQRSRSPQSPSLATPSASSSASSSRLHSRQSSANSGPLADSTGSLASVSSAQGVDQPSLRSQRSVQQLISHTADGNAAVPAGTLTPTSLFTSSATVSASAIHSHFMRRRSLPAQLPGGRLNFVKFETADIQSCVNSLIELISLSAKANNVSLEQMRKGVKLMATGGGAHLFYDMFERELGVEVRREDEMGCLITGLNFITLIPDETFYYSDELVDNINATRPGPRTKRKDDSRESQDGLKSGDALVSSATPPQAQQNPQQQQQPPQQLSLPRPSPDPPLYSPVFDSNPLPKLPCLLVNIGSGVSIIKVDEDGKYERVSGTSLGGGTLWGLLSLVTDADSFDEMLEMASRGDNGSVDMLVSDVYGASDALNNLGLKSTTIASSFGKVFRKDKSASSAEGGSEERRKRFRQEDICKSLLYAISNNIGQIAYMNAEKFGLDRIYFGGCFIRGHQATIATLSYAIRFWSKGTKRAFFLRHEGYLGALGAWIRQFYDTNGIPTAPHSPNPAAPPPQQQRQRQEAPQQQQQSSEVTPATVLASSAALKRATKTPASSTQPDDISLTPINITLDTSETATPRQEKATSPLSHTDALSTASSRTSVAPASSPQNGINSILAEALGGMDVDGSGNSTPRRTQVNGIHHQAATEPARGAHGEANGKVDDADDAPVDITKLSQSLSPAELELLEPILNGRGDDLAAALNGSGEGDEASIAELLTKMDAMHGAADGLEGKLDSLLARLDGILENAPAPDSM